MLTAVFQKFGQAGFFTIYQDFAIHSLSLSLTDSGIGGTIYGCTAVAGTALVMLSHALKINYSKLVALIVCAALNGVAIILFTVAEGKVKLLNQTNSFRFLSFFLIEVEGTESNRL